MTHAAFTLIGPERPSRIICLCDHATNHVPAHVNGGTLGLPPADMERHIAYDIGAAGVTRALADLLDGPALLSNFSCLVIDPNRAEQDPTALMRIYDGTLIPANRHADADEKERRLNACHRPYHAAAGKLVASRPAPLLKQFRSESDICVGDNQPYSGDLLGDTMDRHALCHGHLHVLIELRNDLISTPQTQKHWAERLAKSLTEAIAHL